MPDKLKLDLGKCMLKYTSNNLLWLISPSFLGQAPKRNYMKREDTEGWLGYGQMRRPSYY